MNKLLTYLITILAAFAFTATAAKAQIKTATDSATQKLTLTILPAVEYTTLSETVVEENPTERITQYEIGVRANTGWTVNYSVYDQGLINPTNCNTSGTIGQRNKNDNYQRFYLICQSSFSWADEASSTSYITYNITPSLG